MTTYPLADRLHRQEAVALGLTDKEILNARVLPSFPVNPNSPVRAIKTGEFRNPKKGEWYLSGAIPEAYKAPNDLSSPYHILKLCKIKRVSTEIIETIKD